VQRGRCDSSYGPLETQVRVLKSLLKTDIRKTPAATSILLIYQPKHGNAFIQHELNRIIRYLVREAASKYHAVRLFHKRFCCFRVDNPDNMTCSSLPHFKLVTRALPSSVPDFCFSMWVKDATPSEMYESVLQFLEDRKKNIQTIIFGDEKPTQHYRWKAFLPRFSERLPKMSNLRELKFVNLDPPLTDEDVDYIQKIMETRKQQYLSNRWHLHLIGTQITVSGALTLFMYRKEHAKHLHITLGSKAISKEDKCNLVKVVDNLFVQIL
jgi:hypothetical protein